MSSPFSSVCKGPASGSPGAWHRAAQALGVRQPRCLVWGSPGAWLQPVVPGPGSTNLVSIAIGIRDVEPRWFGGQVGVACKGTHRLWGRDGSASAALRRRWPPDLPVSLAQQPPFLPEEAYRLSASSRSCRESRKIKRDLKRK